MLHTILIHPVSQVYATNFNQYYRQENMGHKLYNAVRADDKQFVTMCLNHAPNCVVWNILQDGGTMLHTMCYLSVLRD